MCLQVQNNHVSGPQRFAGREVWKRLPSPNPCSKQDQQGLVAQGQVCVDSKYTQGWRSLGNLLQCSVPFAVKKREKQQKRSFLLSVCTLYLWFCGWASLRSLAGSLLLPAKYSHTVSHLSEQSQLSQPVLMPHSLPSLNHPVKPYSMLYYCGVPALLTQFSVGACSRDQHVCHWSSGSLLCSVHLQVRGLRVCLGCCPECKSSTRSKYSKFCTLKKAGAC